MSAAVAPACTVTISFTEIALFAALRALLRGVLPAGTEIIRGQVNRVAEPRGADFVVLTPTLRVRTHTNTDSYRDIPGAGVQDALGPTQITIQIDVHGPNSADNVQIVATLFRSDYACLALSRAGVPAQPLYAGEPHQAPFVNGEGQFEYRWSVDAVLQANITVTTPQEFADHLTIGLIDVDSAYPPGGG